MVPVAREGDVIVLSVRRTRRDLRVSALVLAAGIGFYVLGLTLHGVTGRDAGGWWPLATAVMVEAGWILLLVGLLFVAVNWWLLRHRGRASGALSTDRTEVGGAERDATSSTGSAVTERPYLACVTCGQVSPAGPATACPRCGSPLPR